MGVREAQRDRLRRTIDWARRIEEHLAPTRERHLGEVHFRPASTGVAMIGLRPDRPQRGRSGIVDLAQLAREFEGAYREACVDCDHGRSTPEKRLQSHLISAAYRSERRLDRFRRGPGEAPLFITDELSLPTENGRIVCDILALHGGVPAVIELKPERQLTRLVAQVSGYAALTDEHSDLFSELYSVILGRVVVLESPCERWIVWPHPTGHETDPREHELAALGVRVVGYTEADEGFEFKVGASIRA